MRRARRRVLKATRGKLALAASLPLHPSLLPLRPHCCLGPNTLHTWSSGISRTPTRRSHLLATTPSLCRPPCRPPPDPSVPHPPRTAVQRAGSPNTHDITPLHPRDPRGVGVRRASACAHVRPSTWLPLSRHRVLTGAIAWLGTHSTLHRRQCKAVAARHACATACYSVTGLRLGAVWPHPARQSCFGR